MSNKYNFSIKVNELLWEKDQEIERLKPFEDRNKKAFESLEKYHKNGYVHSYAFVEIGEKLKGVEKNELCKTY